MEQKAEQGAGVVVTKRDVHMTIALANTALKADSKCSFTLVDSAYESTFALSLLRSLRHVNVSNTVFRSIVAVLCTLFCSMSLAGVLPADRSDVLYHSYSGGGVDINGPSILVRKQVGESFSLSANYYVDMVSSASIDVEVAASKYTEERVEKTLGVDYLNQKTLISVGGTTSDENDYNAQTYFMSVSQDFFGDLTNLSFSYAQGNDDIGQRDAGQVGELKRHNYSLSLTQILTASSLVSFSFNTIADEGYLNNPYRFIRHVDGAGFKLAPEKYPNTRTSYAYGLRGRYFLPYRAALYADGRFFNDTWGINSYNLELGYVHPFGRHFTTEVRYRYYQQEQADFYSDLFPYADSQTFMARDKEMSTYSNYSVGLSVGYEYEFVNSPFVDKLGVHFNWDHIQFDFDNFRDARQNHLLAGTEPLYSFSADVIRLFVSLYY